MLDSVHLFNIVGHIMYRLTAVYLTFLFVLRPALVCVVDADFGKRVLFLLGLAITGLVAWRSNRYFWFLSIISSIFFFFVTLALFFTNDDLRAFQLGYLSIFSQIGIAYILIRDHEKLKPFMVKLYFSYILLIATFWVLGYNAHFTILGLSQNSIWTYTFVLCFIIFILDELDHKKMNDLSKICMTISVFAISFYSNGRAGIILSFILLVMAMSHLFRRRKYKLFLIGGMASVIVLLLPVNTYGPRAYKSLMCNQHLSFLENCTGMDFSYLKDEKYDHLVYSSWKSFFSRHGTEGEFNSSYDFPYFRKNGLYSPRFEMWREYILSLDFNSLLFGNQIVRSEWLIKRGYKSHAANHHSFFFEIHKHAGLLGLCCSILLFLLTFISIFRRNKLLGGMYFILLVRAGATKFILFSPLFFIILLPVAFILEDCLFEIKKRYFLMTEYSKGKISVR